ncbi:MAG: hypothetical protein FJ218_00925 [Ignavibacteria bacterium]|nr:hypothetical protein [Ignavibacteria bacterium]
MSLEEKVEDGVIFAIITTVVCLGISKVHIHESHRNRFIKYYQNINDELNIINDELKEKQNIQDHNNPIDPKLQQDINALILKRDGIINKLDIDLIINSLPPDDDDTRKQLTWLTMKQNLTGEERTKWANNILTATLKDYKFWIWMDRFCIVILVFLEVVLSGEGAVNIINIYNQYKMVNGEMKVIGENQLIKNAIYSLPGFVAFLGGLWASPILEKFIYGERVVSPGLKIGTEYKVFITAQNGKVVKSPNYTNYAQGSFVQLLADPSQGFRFVNWSGDIQSEQNPNVIMIDGNKNITANFAALD